MECEGLMAGYRKLAASIAEQSKVRSRLTRDHKLAGALEDFPIREVNAYHNPFGISLEKVLVKRSADSLSARAEWT